MLVERLAKALLTAPQAFVALVEAIDGETSEAELVASIRAAQIRAAEVAVEADIGPRP